MRGAVLLIVIPAFLIVTVYFLSIFREIVTDKYEQDVIEYENRLAPLKKDLPAYAIVNWISDQKNDDDFVIARYALIPARLVEDPHYLARLIAYIHLNPVEAGLVEDPAEHVF